MKVFSDVSDSQLEALAKTSREQWILIEAETSCRLSDTTQSELKRIHFNIMNIGSNRLFLIKVVHWV